MRYDGDLLAFMNMGVTERKQVISALYDVWRGMGDGDPRKTDMLVGIRALDALHHQAKSVTQVMAS